MSPARDTPRPAVPSQDTSGPGVPFLIHTTLPEEFSIYSDGGPASEVGLEVCNGLSPSALKSTGAGTTAAEPI